MNQQKKTNLTIHLFADDQYRSTNRNNNTINLDSSPVHIVYPALIDGKTIPSVPLCYNGETQSENIDQQVEGASAAAAATWSHASHMPTFPQSPVLFSFPSSREERK